MSESSSKRRKTTPQKVSDPNLPIEDVELMDVEPSANGIPIEKDKEWWRRYELEVRRRNPAIYAILDRPISPQGQNRPAGPEAPRNSELLRALEAPIGQNRPREPRNQALLQALEAPTGQNRPRPIGPEAPRNSALLRALEAPAGQSRPIGSEAPRNSALLRALEAPTGSNRPREPEIPSTSRALVPAKGILSEKENDWWIQYELEARRRNPALFEALEAPPKSPVGVKRPLESESPAPAPETAPDAPSLVKSPEEVMQMVRQKVKPKKKRPTFSRRLQNLPMPDTMRIAERTEQFVKLIVESNESGADVRELLPKLSEVDIPQIMRRLAELCEVSFKEIAMLFYELCKEEMAVWKGQDMTNLIEIVRALDEEVLRLKEKKGGKAGPSMREVVADLRDVVGQQQAARAGELEVTINRGNEGAPPTAPTDSSSPGQIASFILWKHR